MAIYTKKTFTDELNLIWKTVTGFKPHWYNMASADVEIADAWEMYENARTSTLAELLLGDLKLRSHVEVLQNFGTTSGTKSTMERGVLYGDNKKKIVTATVQAVAIAQQGKAYKASDGVALIRKGSVLNDGWWWPFKNDAWVIGGIHGLKRFHLTMASVPDDLIWDDKEKRPRVLGRELLGLAAFGYSLIGVPAWAKKVPPPKVVAPTTNAPNSNVQVAKPEAPKTVPVSASDVRAMIGHVFAPQKSADALAATFTAYYAALDKVKGIDAINGKDSILTKEVAFEAYDFSKI